MTPLMKAVNKNNPEALKAAIDRGGDINKRFAGTLPMLGVAAGLGYLEITKILLDTPLNDFVKCVLVSYFQTFNKGIPPQNNPGG